MDTKRKIVRIIWGFNAAAFLGLIVLVVSILWIHEGVSIPSVLIHTPSPAMRVKVGDVVPVHSTSSDPENKIVRVELWVDNRLVEVNTSSEGSSVFSTAMAWQPVEPGSYIILVRAVNGENNTGQASLTIDVEDPNTMMEEEDPLDQEPDNAFDDGLVSFPPGGYSGGIQPAELIAASFLENTSDTMLPPDPDRQVSEAEVVDFLGDLLLNQEELQDGSGWAELSATRFEVNRVYDRIYVYVSIADGPVQRCPERNDEYFAPDGERSWDIGEYLAGENRIQLLVQDGGSFNLIVEGYGWKGSELSYLGRVEMENSSDFWDGRDIIVESEGGDGFLLSYQVDGPEFVPKDGIPAPQNLGMTELLGDDYVHWVWHGNRESIDGFRIYRDHVLVGTVPAENSFYALRILPPCNEIATYTITAYKGGSGPDRIESPHSDSKPVVGPVCGSGNNLGTPTVVEGLCSGGAVVIELPYTYYTDHGTQVYAVAWAQTESMMVAAGQVRVAHGDGVARIELANMLPGVASTDKLFVHLMDENGWYFYSEEVALPILWDEALPDLVISYADAFEGIGKVRIRNEGCASVEGFSLLVQPVEGSSFSETFDRYLAPGITYSYDTTNMDLVKGFIAEVDPQNEIREMNEDNNIYERGPIRLKHILIYQIDIHDTSEGGLNGRAGEFQFIFTANDYMAWLPAGSDSHLVLNRGEHPLYGFVGSVLLTPELEWDEDLVFHARGIEDDTAPFDFDDLVGYVDFVHSQNMSEAGNWKEGGTFSMRSTTGHYTVHWQVAVE
ncbi:MAG: hypothetical protein JXA25_17520 [Anaerolineales bacterium]|nr:hypothetical protein [Anaerolineales bacterium]